MKYRNLVDAQIVATLDAFPGFHLSMELLPVIRAHFPIAEIVEDPDVDVTELHIPGPDGAADIRLLRYLPKGATGLLPALLHIHGGGYIMGKPEMNDGQSKRLARTIGCAVFSVDYRLAPETPYPGPLEDCYAALRWLRQHASEQGVDADRIAIGGESAGGGLAAALTLLARDRGEIPICFQYLTYPMLDDRTGTIGELHDHAETFTWNADANRFGWASLLGQAPGGEAVSPYAAPARASDLAGLPPTFIGVGALDLFVEESVAFAGRLTRVGVPTELHVYPGAFHGFNNIEADVSRRFHRDQDDALRRAFRKGHRP